jgi:hypothetical protein
MILTFQNKTKKKSGRKSFEAESTIEKKIFFQHIIFKKKYKDEIIFYFKLYRISSKILILTKL